MSNETLLPCPFCGGDAERITIEESGDNFGGDVIQCMGMCGASSHVEFGRKENLVSLWNTRLSSTLPIVPDERLREALEPFARIADGLDPLDWDDAEWLDGDEVPMQVGDFRRARAALNGEG